MGLLSLAGAVCLLTVAALYSVVKIMVYQLQVEQGPTKALRYSKDAVQPFYTAGLAVVALVEFWPGVASWSGDVVAFVAGVVM